MANNHNRIRLALDASRAFANPINLATKRTAIFPRTRATRVEVGVYDNGTFQQSISQYDSMTLEIMAANAVTGSRIVTKTVSAAAFTPGVAESEWLNGSKQHAVFELTPAQTSAFTVGSDLTQALWLVITAASAAGDVTMLAGPAVAQEDGGLTPGAGAPQAGDPLYPTLDKVVALVESRMAQTRRLVSEDGLSEVIIKVKNGKVFWEARPL